MFGLAAAWFFASSKRESKHVMKINEMDADQVQGETSRGSRRFSISKKLARKSFGLLLFSTPYRLSAFRPDSVNNFRNTLPR